MSAGGLQVAGAVAGIITGCGVLSGGALWAATRIRRYWETHFMDRLGDLLGDFPNDWKGAPARPGVEARPGVMETISSLRQQVASIQAELRVNGGATLRDAVNRVEKQVESIQEEVYADAGSTLRDAVNRVEKELAEIRKRMELFEAERAGRDVTRWPEHPENHQPGTGSTTTPGVTAP